MWIPRHTWLLILLLGWTCSTPLVEKVIELADNSTDGITHNTSMAKIDTEDFIRDTPRKEDPTNLASSELLRRCSLLPENSDVSRKIDDISDDTKLILYTLQIKDFVPNFSPKTRMFKPLTWVRSTGRNGTGLLMLRPEFDTLSLTTLAFHVEEVNVSLVERPSKCLSRLTNPEVEELFRYTVMDNFGNNTSGKPTMHMQHQVCNNHIVDEQGTASFKYFCCKVSEEGDVSCEYLQTDVWWQGLLITIIILKLFLILFWPKFIPRSIYQEEFTSEPYLYKQSFSLKVVKSEKPDKYQTRAVMKMSEVRHMEKFRNAIKEMENDVPATMNVHQTALSVTNAVLLSGNNTPVGILSSLYASLYKCKIRKQPAVSGCCRARICPSSCTRDITWFVTFRSMMKVLLVLFISSPWIVRVWVYFAYEDEEMDLRKTVASERGLTIYFPGSFSLYMTPLHATFIFMYILLAVESVLIRAVRKETVDAFKYVLRKCFRDTKETDRIHAFEWAIKLLLKPFTKFGCLGLIVGLLASVFTLPVVVVVLSFYFLPTLNLTYRLFAHFVVYLVPRNVCETSGKYRLIHWLLAKLEAQLDLQDMFLREKLMKNENILSSPWKRTLQLVAILLCLISVYCIIYLMYEFVSFIVEIFIYTVMGLIVNADTTMTYMSLAALIGAYGINCYRKVDKKYLKFNRTLNSAIANIGMNSIEKVVYLNAVVQGNNVFKIQTENNSKQDNKLHLKMDDHNRLRLMTSRLLLFLSKRDAILIPKKFFFATSTLDYFGVPGKLFVNYIKASLEFGGIILFLVFVLNVVLAFGNVYEISTTNKLLGTIAGGFIPFMVQILFKSNEPEVIDTDSLAFKVCLNEAIEDYTQSFPVRDLNASITNGPIVTTKNSKTLNTATQNGIGGNTEIRRHNGTMDTPKEVLSNGTNGTITSNGTVINGKADKGRISGEHSTETDTIKPNGIKDKETALRTVDDVKENDETTVTIIITDTKDQDVVDGVDGTYRRFEEEPLIEQETTNDDDVPEFVDLVIDTRKNTFLMSME